MIKVALVEEASGGLIIGVITPYDDTAYPDRSYDIDGRLRIHIPFETEDHSFISQFHWNGTDWVDRGPPPTYYYDWNGAWIFNPSRYLVDAERLKRIKMGEALGKKSREKLTDMHLERINLYIKQLRQLDLLQWEDTEQIEWPAEVL